MAPRRGQKPTSPWAKFRILTMVTVLKEDCHVRYNPERIAALDFRDSKDLFLHGLVPPPLSSQLTKRCPTGGAFKWTWAAPLRTRDSIHPVNKEPTMSTKNIRTFLVLIPLLLFPQSSQAFYNPSTGRWLNRDPLRERGGRNLYAFVNNTPTTRIDLFGLKDHSVTVMEVVKP